MSKNDGGAAFPIPDLRHEGGLDGSYGMSLRDYFAAKAMQAIIGLHGVQSALDSHLISTATVAKASYGWADEMIRARDAICDKQGDA